MTSKKGNTKELGDLNFNCVKQRVRRDLETVLTSVERFTNSSLHLREVYNQDVPLSAAVQNIINIVLAALDDKWTNTLPVKLLDLQAASVCPEHAVKVKLWVEDCKLRCQDRWTPSTERSSCNTQCAEHWQNYYEWFHLMRVLQGKRQNLNRLTPE
jgi:hypothetical protein